MIVTNTFSITVNTSSPTTLFSFSPGSDKGIDCVVHQTTETDTIISALQITHDGITTSELQNSISQSNTRPNEIMTAVVGNTGMVTVTPTSVPCTFTGVYNKVQAQSFGEHTQSGKIILGNTGFGLVFAGTANNYTIRQANNNVFDNGNLLLVANTLGPAVTGSQLFDKQQLIEFDGSTIIANDNFVIIQSSGQTRNCHYIELNTVAGEVYRLSTGAYYTFDQQYAKTVLQTQHKPSMINIGTQVAKDDLFQQFVQPETSTNYTIDFVATSNTSFVSFGHGGIGTQLYLANTSIQRIVPFQTYDQSIGTLFVKWGAISAGQTLVTMSNNTIAIDGSNNATFNNVVCGAQQVTNKLAVSRGLVGDLVFVFNGGTPAANVGFKSPVTSVIFNNVPLQFSYANQQLSNTQMIELTNG